MGKRYKTLLRSHILEHQDSDNKPDYPLVFNAKTGSNFMISQNFKHKQSEDVLKVFINEMEAIHIKNVIVEGVFRVENSKVGLKKGRLNPITDGLSVCMM